jgi:hypothetical protein
MLNNWIKMSFKLFLTKQHGILACLLIKNDKGELGHKTVYLRLKFMLNRISTCKIYPRDQTRLWSGQNFH